MIEEYKQQSIMLFGLENPYTIAIFMLDEIIKDGKISLEEGLKSMEDIFKKGLKEEVGLVL